MRNRRIAVEMNECSDKSLIIRFSENLGFGEWRISVDSVWGNLKWIAVCIG